MKVLAIDKKIKNRNAEENVARLSNAANFLTNFESLSMEKKLKYVVRNKMGRL